MSRLRTSGAPLPTSVQLLQVADQAIAGAGEQLRPQAEAAYRTWAPGGVAGAVTSRVVRDHGYKLIVHLDGKTIYTAVGYWTNFGTGVHGVTKQPIRRRPGTGQQRRGASARPGVGRGGKRLNGGMFASAEGPRPPFRLKNGAIVAEIKGQRPQGWVDNARRQADASARVIVESQTDKNVSDLMRKALR